MSEDTSELHTKLTFDHFSEEVRAKLLEQVKELEATNAQTRGLNIKKQLAKTNPHEVSESTPEFVVHFLNELNQNPDTRYNAEPVHDDCLRSSVAIASRMLTDSYFLPTREELKTAFGFPNYAQVKPGDLAFHSEVDNEFRHVNWGARDVFDAYIRTREHFEVLQFEILSVEYIQALAGYLYTNFASALSKKGGVIEVCAGTGSLTYHLNTYLRALDSSFEIVATSLNNSDDPYHHTNRAGVALHAIDNIDATTAVRKYKPALVLCSWLPYGTEFDKDFRAQPNVSGYILIGPEADWIGCGAETFGSPHSTDVPQFEKDGFEKVYIDLGIQPNSSHSFSEECLSKTILFRRKT